MNDVDLMIRGGRIATAADVFDADLGVKDGKIGTLGSRLGPGAREIDACGKLVLPGGVDSHCHIEEPQVGQVRNADSFTSGTASAAAGGTTTVICFSGQTKGGTITQPLRDYHRKAEQALIDYSFHLVVTDPSDAVLTELPSLIDEGHRSIKIFLTYDNMALNDHETLEVLALAPTWPGINRSKSAGGLRSRKLPLCPGARRRRRLLDRRTSPSRSCWRSLVGAPGWRRLDPSSSPSANAVHDDILSTKWAA